MTAKEGHCFATGALTQRPLAGRTTGTVNPGVIWVSRYLQVGVEQSSRSMPIPAATSVCARRPTFIFPRSFPIFTVSRSSASE